MITGVRWWDQGSPVVLFLEAGCRIPGAKLCDSSRRVVCVLDKGYVNSGDMLYDLWSMVCVIPCGMLSDYLGQVVWFLEAGCVIPGGMWSDSWRQDVCFLEVC